MPWTRPTLADLIATAQADIESRLPGADASLRRSNLNVLAKVKAGGEHGLYGFIERLADQILPDRAEREALLRHASLWLGEGLQPATYAAGAATVTGVNGTVIVADTIYTRNDGAQFAVIAPATIASGTATIQLVALVAGADGNTAEAVTLNLSTPIAGLASTATVAAGGIAGGTDEEDIESLRGRVVGRIRRPPHGGAHFDYVTWAKEVPGVTRAWYYPEELGRGTGTVRFVRDNDASLIPDAPEVADVQSYIDYRRPAAADISVVAPIADPINFTIHLDPDTPAIRAAVEAELRDLLAREATPGGTYRDLDTGAPVTGGMIPRTHITEAISIAAGENDHTLTVPAGNITSATGHMPTFGVIAWA